MALRLYHRFPEPEGKERDIANLNIRVALNMSTPAHNLAIGSLLKSATTGYDGLTSGDDSVYAQAMKYFDVYGNSIDSGFLNTTQLAAAQYYALCRPIGNIVWEITEDAAGSNAGGGAFTYTGGIPDAAAQGGYFDLVVGTAFNTGGSAFFPWSKAKANILIDSSSGSSSSSSKCVQLLGVANKELTQYDGTTARTFRATFVTPGTSL